MKFNKKGFTLIELLAVIVILGVLLTVAIPAVTKYINSSKKGTYITNAKLYADEARNGAITGEFKLPIGTNQATIVMFSKILPKLEKGGTTSPYGGTYEENNSFVVIVNEATADNPKYVYYIAARDNKGYGIGNLAEGATTATAAIIEYDQLKESNIVQLATGATYTEPAGTTPGSVTVNGKVVSVTTVEK